MTLIRGFLNNKNEAQSFRQILNNAIKKEIINMVKYFTYEKNLSFFTFSTAENKETHRKNKAEMRDIAIRFWNTPGGLKSSSCASESSISRIDSKKTNLRKWREFSSRAGERAEIEGK